MADLDRVCAWSLSRYYIVGSWLLDWVKIPSIQRTQGSIQKDRDRADNKPQRSLFYEGEIKGFYRQGKWGFRFGLFPQRRGPLQARSK